MTNFCPSGFCGPPRLICTMLKTEWWTLYTLGKRSTKWATCPALFCFLSTALETQGFPHTEHKQQRLFCANKCVLLIADAPFHAKSVQWQVADRYVSELAVCAESRCSQLPGVAFTHLCFSTRGGGALVLPTVWLPQKDWGCHIPTGFSGVIQARGKKSGNEHRNPYLNGDSGGGSEQLRSGM